MRRVIALFLLSLAVAGTAVAGFAAANGPDAGRDTTTISVHIFEWGFALSSDHAPVGTVVFNVVNDGEFEHDFGIDSTDTPLLKQGDTATVTVNFTEPGMYGYSSTHDDIDRDMYGVFTVTGTAVSTTTTARTTTSTTTTPPPPSTLPLQRVADVPLTGGSSRFDYQSLDAARNRLYISHLGAGSIVVFDTRRRRVVTTIGGVPGVHGVLAVPALGRLYAAATDARRLDTIRERDNAIVASTPAGAYPDGIAFDPARREVFVSDESGGAETVVGAGSGRRLATISLGGEAGNVQYDPGSQRIFADVQTRDELVAIDPRRRRIVAHYSLPGCQHDHGLYVDATRRLAFVACDGNARLLVFDLQRKRVTSTFTVGAEPDVLAFDTSLRRLYVAAESGVVAVFAEHGRTLRKLGEGLLAPTAHSVAVDARTHLVYFPLEDVGGRPVLRIMRPRP